MREPPEYPPGRRSEARGDGAPGAGEAGAVRAVEVVVGDPPEAWAALGFALDSRGALRLGEVVVRPAGGGGGLLRVGVEGLAAERPDGFELVAAAASADGAGEHPNGARA